LIRGKRMTIWRALIIPQTVCKEVDLKKLLMSTYKAMFMKLLPNMADVMVIFNFTASESNASSTKCILSRITSYTSFAEEGTSSF
jgi:hypothetical protein